MKIRLFFLFLIIILSGFGITFSEYVLKLEEAVELALQNNRNLLVMKMEMEYADSQITEAYGAAFPVIGVNLGSKHQNRVRTMMLPTEEGVMEIPMGSKDNYFGNINITQPLWVGGKVGSALEGAKQFRKFMAHNFQNTRQQIIYVTKVSYYSVVLSDAAVDISGNALLQAEKHYEQVKNMHDQGIASRFDLLRSEVAVSNLRPAYIQAKNNYELALVRLKNIIGMNLDEKILVDGNLEYEPEKVSELDLYELAFSKREDLKAIDLQIDMNETIHRIFRADYYPSVFFMADYSASRDKTAKNDIYAELSASFVIRWNFDFGTKGRIKQADVRIRQAIYNREQLKADIEYEVKQAYLNLKEAESIIISQQRVIDIAEEALQIAEVRYESGTGTHLEVTDAQFSLNLARTNYIQALFGYYVAKTTIDKVTGIL